MNRFSNSPIPYSTKIANLRTTAALGYIILIQNDTDVVQKASILTYLNESEVLQDIIHSIISYGSSNVAMNDFVVKWNNSYETVLHSDGRIDIKYFTLHKK